METDGLDAMVRAVIPAVLVGDPDAIVDAYRSKIRDAVAGYLESDRPITSFRNAARIAVADDFPKAFYTGYVDAGGEETEDEDEQWLTQAINAELGHVDDLFATLRALRAEGVDAQAEADRRADGYASTLRGIYAEGKARGNKNKMLTFDGDDGEESCADCQRYKGQRHSARWWLRRDLVRRNGNPNYACGRWENCRHHFYTDNGQLYAE